MHILVIAGISLLTALAFGAVISLFLHEDAVRPILYFGAAAAAFTILSAATRKPPDLAIVAVGVIVGVLLVTYAVVSPKRRDRVFALGTDLGRQRMPPAPRQDEGLPLASILSPLLQIREISQAPPVGYWSVILPGSMVLGHSYSVTINLPAVGGFSGEADIDAWLKSIGYDPAAGITKPVTIRPLTQHFAVQPDERNLRLRPKSRQSALFLVTPTKPGRRPLRFELLVGDEMMGWSQEMIRIRRNTQVVLAAATMSVGLVGATLGILSNLNAI